MLDKKKAPMAFCSIGVAAKKATPNAIKSPWRFDARFESRSHKQKRTE